MEPVHPLRSWRAANGHTLVSLAELLGVVASHLSQIETGMRGLSPDLAKKIEETTKGGVTREQLLWPERAA